MGAPPMVMGGVPLGMLSPGQCVIQTPTILFQWPMSFGARTVWLDNVHIRLQRNEGTQEIGSLLEWGPSSPNLSVLWVTNSTFQGDGAGGANGISILASEVLVQGARVPCGHTAATLV